MAEPQATRHTGWGADDVVVLPGLVVVVLVLALVVVLVFVLVAAWCGSAGAVCWVA